MYHFSKASADFAAFAAHLQRAQIASALQVSSRPDVAAVSTPPPLTVHQATTSKHYVGSKRHDAQTTQQPYESTELHPSLTSAWAHKHARGNVVIVTWSNWHFIDFVENWAAHLARHSALYLL